MIEPCSDTDWTFDESATAPGWTSFFASAFIPTSWTLELLSLRRRQGGPRRNMPGRGGRRKGQCGRRKSSTIGFAAPILLLLRPGNARMLLRCRRSRGRRGRGGSSAPSRSRGAIRRNGCSRRVTKRCHGSFSSGRRTGRHKAHRQASSSSASPAPCNSPPGSPSCKATGPPPPRMMRPADRVEAGLLCWRRRSRRMDRH